VTGLDQIEEEAGKRHLRQEFAETLFDDVGVI
jgi:hypothetical protein